jgi:hypothetical protein
MQDTNLIVPVWRTSSPSLISVNSPRSIAPTKVSVPMSSKPGLDTRVRMPRDATQGRLLIAHWSLAGLCCYKLPFISCCRRVGV